VKVPPELAHVGIVAIEECDPMSGQALHQLIFGARDARHAIGKILRVGAADVGDDTPIGVSDAGQRRDFAGCDIPISITAISCSGSSLSSCKGMPNSLLRFPCDRSTLKRAPRTSATASLVVVLPALPVTPMTRLFQCLRTAVASVCSATSGSSTISSVWVCARSSRSVTLLRETTAARAPRSSAAATKSCAS
jgi:hypothetical protein